MTPYHLIARKRDGCEHSLEELRFLARAVADGTMPDYQAAAWLMAVYLRGMTRAETVALTLAMRDSGERVCLDDIPGVKLDKHSSGGVGDKTTLVVAPMLAAAGVPMLKMSGRGLGFSGGTIDKLESIPGLRTDLTVEAARTQVKRVGLAVLGQTPSLVPADKKLYALRDVTATIDCLPLIASSIMSKKLAGGADAVVLDVKVGSGSFQKTLDPARTLARTLVDIGVGAGVRTVAALTAMDEPLGWAVGNALEVAEACAVLTGRGRVDARFQELCVALAARGLVLAGIARGDAEGRVRAGELLASGAAADRLEQMAAAQGGDPGVVRDPARLPQARVVRQVPSRAEGFVAAIDAEAIGWLSVGMGAGRRQKEGTIDPAAGIVLERKVGDPVAPGDVLAVLHLRDEREADAHADALRAAYTLADMPPNPLPVVYEVVE